MIHLMVVVVALAVVCGVIWQGESHSK
jgi:hypothetical protein